MESNDSSMPAGEITEADRERRKWRNALSEWTIDASRQAITDLLMEKDDEVAALRAALAELLDATDAHFCQGEDYIAEDEQAECMRCPWCRARVALGRPEANAVAVGTPSQEDVLRGLRDASSEQEPPIEREAHAHGVADAWNEAHPIGSPVCYWPGLRKGDGIWSNTRTHASVLGGHTPVVWVEGRSDCIALTHVEVRRVG